MQTVEPAAFGRMSRMLENLIVRGLLLVNCWFLLSGCQQPRPAERPEVASGVTVQAQSELRERLNDFIQFAQSRIEATAADVERRSSEKSERHAAALWRGRMVAEFRATADQDDPREVLVDLWTLCRRLQAFLSEGEGKSIFGSFQASVVACSEDVSQSFERLVRQYVPADSMPRLSEKIAAYSRSNPIRESFVVAPAERFSDTPEIEKGLGELVRLPLAPMMALGAIARTPESVRDVSKSVYRFSDVLEDLPTSARWQLQLLGMNLEESTAVSTTVDSFKKLSDSSSLVADNSTRFVRTFDEMPGRVRAEAEVLLKTVDASQPRMQATLKESQKTATAIQGASQDIRETATALEKAAVAVTATAQEVLKFVPASMKDQTGQIISGGDSDRGAGSPSSRAESNHRPGDGVMPPAVAGVTPTAAQAPASGVPDVDADTRFSFQAVTRSADSLGATTEKLRQLLGDVRALAEHRTLSSETGVIDGQVRGAVDFSATKLRAVVDHAAKRSAQLILLTFALVVVYQVIASRIRRPRAAR